MALEFYPFEEGQVLTSSDLNQLVESIQNGTIFLNTTYISEQLATNSSRMSSLEARVEHLESMQSYLAIREQFVLAAGQAIIPLVHTPILDTELVFLNGVSQSRSGIPASFIGDYSLAGSTLTLSSEVASQVEAGDILIVHYRYGV